MLEWPGVTQLQSAHAYDFRFHVHANIKFAALTVHCFCKCSEKLSAGELLHQCDLAAVLLQV